MHRGENAGADKEGADQRQGEGENGEQDGPAGEAAALFGHDGRMQQRRADQPWHEAGIFHRIPEPPAAPAQFIIGPETAQRDAAGKRHPGGQHPRPHPARPGRISAAFQQRRHGKAEGDGKADIAQVQQRRMEDEAGILQQRVQFRAVERHREQALKRVGREQREGKEGDTDHRLHRKNARLQRDAQIVAELRNASAIDRQHQHPQQHGAFVIAPRRRQPIGQRLRKGAVIGDQLDREIGLAEQRHQAAKADGDQQRLQGRRAAPERHQRRIPADRAQHRQRSLRNRHQQGEDQGEMADFGKHLRVVSGG